MRKILDLGCGNNKYDGAIGVDISPTSQADIIHNLNKFPWPFSDNEFDEVICNDILEHLDEIVPVIEEIHRITKSGGLLKIRIPHFSNHNAYCDITHKHFFSSESFDYFTEQNPFCKLYSNAAFEKVEMRFSFPKLTRFISFFARKWPVRYERYLAWTFPAGNMEFELRVLKEQKA